MRWIVGGALMGILLWSAARPGEPSPTRRAPATFPQAASSFSPGSSAHGPVSPVPESLEEVIRRLQKTLEEGHYSEVERDARDLLIRAEKAPGFESAEVCDVLDLLLRALLKMGRSGDPETRTLAERGVTVSRNVFGEDHLSFARSLNRLGIVLQDLSDFDGAKANIDRALAIREKELGADHPQVAEILNNLANLAMNTGDYEGSRKIHERSLAIREKSDGPDDPSVALALHGLGLSLHYLGDLPGAKAAWERALAIFEKNYPPSHHKVSATLNNLGNLLYLMGEMTHSRELREKVLETWEKTLGPDHTHVAYALNNLGVSRLDAGDLAGARTMFERALAIHEKNFGPDHLEVAFPLMNLAGLAFKLGDYEEMRRRYQRVLAVREKALGPDHPQVAGDLTSLGVALMNMGDDPGAQALFERALVIQEKALGPDHPEVAYSVFNLGLIRENANDWAAARSLLERALLIRQKARGAECQEVAEALEALGEIAYKTGDDAEAKQRFVRAMEIREKVFGTDHPNVAWNLNNLAMLSWKAGDGPSALDQSLRAEKILREQFQRTAASLAEREALRFEVSRVSGLSVALSVLASASSGQAQSPREAGRIWDAVIRSRALVLDEMARRHRTLVQEQDPELSDLSGALVAARDRLASLVVRGPNPEDPEGYRQEATDARLEKERAERQLAERSASFRRRLASYGVGLAEVKAALPSDWALVAYVGYNRISRTDEKGGKSAPRPEPSSSYLALVMGRAGQKVSVFPIGTAAEVDPLIEAWKKEFASAPAGLPISGSLAEKRYRDIARRLRKVVWDPPARGLMGARKVFVIPDGALNAINLATLPSGRTGYLVESGPLFHYLSAERDLIRTEVRSPSSGEILVVGGPDFDAAPAGFSGEQSPAATGSGRLFPAVYRGPRAACGDFQSLRFDPLPGSAAEVREVESIWSRNLGVGEAIGGSVVTLTGVGASEAAFKRMAPGWRVLHLATHGFFVQERCESDLENARARARETLRSSRDGLPILGDNPLLLSGLALAGANRRNEAGSRPDQEDGILTAEEIASLDLSATEWAVLSACETGLGVVQAGEGVLGLRRAFEIAGAGTLIMSLWRVEDDASREWMGNLYRSRLAGMSTADSVRQAALKMLEDRRDRDRTTHPFYWGAFVAAGDWN